MIDNKMSWGEELWVSHFFLYHFIHIDTYILSSFNILLIMFIGLYKYERAPSPRLRYRSHNLSKPMEHYLFVCIYHSYLLIDFHSESVCDTLSTFALAT